MTDYNSLNVKASNSHLNKSKLAPKNETEVVLTLSSDTIGRFNDETNFLLKLLLNNRQVGSLRKAFRKYLSTDNKLSKTQLSRMIQWGRFLGRLLRPLLKTGLPLMKNEIQPLAKTVLTPVGLSSAVSAADAGIHKRVLGSGTKATTLMTSNDEMEGIIKIVKYLEDSCLLLKGVNETIKNEAKEQKGGLPSMLLVTLYASSFWKICQQTKEWIEQEKDLLELVMDLQ